MSTRRKLLPAIKRGDTFHLGCLSRGVSGAPDDLTDIGIRSQVREEATDALVANLEVVKLDQGQYPGQFSLSAADTGAWPITMCLIDIELSVGGVVSSTDTARLPVIKDVTHD